MWSYARAVGIFTRRIEAAYEPKLNAPPVVQPLSIASPWAPQDTLLTFALDDALGGLLSQSVAMTRDIALRIPGVKRAHGLHVGMFAQLPFYEMDGDARTDQQPAWLTNSASGVSPYHRMYGLGSDLFFNGWGCLGFTADMTDCLHIPFGLWSVDDRSGVITVDEQRIPAKYRARPVAIPLGYGENGLLNDGIDTLREARQIETAYVDRLNNPVPLTVLGIPKEVWELWTPDERKDYRDQYVSGRKANNGAVALKVSEFPIEFPDAASNGVDLFESGRNAVRLDLANHTSTPAGFIEGVRQGGSGGGTEIRYSGVANGAGRHELWDYGLAKKFALAFEARMSLDDIVPSGRSIRADLSIIVDIPTPPSSPTSED